MSYVKELIPPRPAPALVEKKMNPARLTGMLVMALWILLALSLIAMVIKASLSSQKYGLDELLASYRRTLLRRTSKLSMKVSCGVRLLVTRDVLRGFSVLKYYRFLTRVGLPLSTTSGEPETIAGRVC